MSEIKQISTGKAELLIVKVPEGAANFAYLPVNEMLQYDIPVNYVSLIKLPQGNWQIVGISDQLTEEQCAELMQSESMVIDNSGNTTLYLSPVDYHATAKEAFASLMQSNECYTLNPYAGMFTPRPPQEDTGDLGKIIGDVIYNDMRDLFLAAEANTGTWLVLKRI
jgi:hypothetical protein